jgi:2-polyprenyl-6-methoxyphenol hydroxylase-like FAD-dependent oxidoreductase
VDERSAGLIAKIATEKRNGRYVDMERILIVGGGIAGLTVAIALHRQCFKPEVIERSTAWPAIGAGIHLPANDVRRLRALGVGESVDRAAEEVGRWSFFEQGELLCGTDLRDLWREVGPCLGITRVKLRHACQKPDRARRSAGHC